MKIGILTLSLHSNYGGILQAYALQTVLERMGNEVVIIQICKSVSFCNMALRVIKRLLLKYLLGRKKIIVFIESKKKKESEVTSQNTLVFINNYIRIKKYKNFSDIHEEDYDAIVVGSDQVWRPDYFRGPIKNAFLAFAKKWKNIKRISYAASFGTDELTYSIQQEQECGQLIKMFDMVSVRELSARDICSKHWNLNVSVVLDPTLLLTKETYEKIVAKANTFASPGSLLCYVLDENEEKQHIIQEISVQRNLVPFRVNSKYEDPTAPLSERIQPSVEQWLRGFMDAEFVITDSFHACVFSIIFRKPFIALGNQKRGMTRFYSLLSMFSIENNLISSIGEYQPNYSYGDYESAIVKLEKYRDMSLSLLKQSLYSNE